MNIDHEKSLKKSEEIVGRIYPVIKDANGKVIDGFHRLDVDPDWDFVILPDVKTKEERLIVGLHANLGRRKISRKEKAEAINDLAEIYWRQGLRPKVSRIIIDRYGRKKNINENQITQKLNHVLKGIVGPTTISTLLLPKYKYTVKAEVQKRIAKERHANTPAIKLIRDSFGKQIEKAFGEGIFGRLEREMITAAKEMLRNDPWWINRIKNELRDEIIAELESSGEIKENTIGCIGDGYNEHYPT
jgi:hypothetical protein